MASLSVLLPHSKLDAIFRACIPWPRSTPLNFTYVRDNASYFDAEAFRDLCFPALERLSEINSLDVADELFTLLPAPESREFPEQALGMLQLLDQGPRQLFEGHDERWTYSYFDILALRLSHRLRALPETLRPDSQRRWVDDMGYTFSHWTIARFRFTAPFTHSESAADQELQRHLCEELRRAVEVATGIRDAYRECITEVTMDPTAFSRQACIGPPAGDAITMAEFVFWFLMIFDTHVSIIRVFGRFPSRNGAVGRTTTEAENRFLEHTGWFGTVEEKVRRRIREDVEAGKWTPLGEP
ncbi:hypothetical protein MMC07_003036 [Pseudocyphellaria aurata]|nr:hypothetical protein [Pseudocyphellaria aurata]